MYGHKAWLLRGCETLPCMQEEVETPRAKRKRELEAASDSSDSSDASDAPAAASSAAATPRHVANATEHSTDASAFAESHEGTCSADSSADAGHGRSAEACSGVQECAGEVGSDDHYRFAGARDATSPHQQAQPAVRPSHVLLLCRPAVQQLRCSASVCAAAHANHQHSFTCALSYWRLSRQQRLQRSH